MGVGGEARVTVGRPDRTDRDRGVPGDVGRRAVAELLPAKDDGDLLAAMRSTGKSGLDAPLVGRSR